MKIWEKILLICGENLFFWSSMEIWEKIPSIFAEDHFYFYFLVFNQFVVGIENCKVAQGATGFESL